MEERTINYWTVSPRNQDICDQNFTIKARKSQCDPTQNIFLTSEYKSSITETTNIRMCNPLLPAYEVFPCETLCSSIWGCWKSLAAQGQFKLTRNRATLQTSIQHNEDRIIHLEVLVLVEMLVLLEWSYTVTIYLWYDTSCTMTSLNMPFIIHLSLIHKSVSRENESNSILTNASKLFSLLFIRFTIC